ncbi:hypothetical protein PATSB16_08810 [Pandoraea thiooxydans]|nr:hypothetical protein PATSB16_08810 [Pandoraea thiooxydans]
MRILAQPAGSRAGRSKSCEFCCSQCLRVRLAAVAYSVAWGE